MALGVFHSSEEEGGGGGNGRKATGLRQGEGEKGVSPVASKHPSNTFAKSPSQHVRGAARGHAAVGAEKGAAPNFRSRP